MRILLISANTEPFPEPVFPIGAVYVADALQRAGARVRIFDMRHNNSGASLKKELANFHPDRIGISLRNVDNAAYPATRFYLPTYSSLVKSVRAFCHAPVILGGSAFSLFPGEITAYLGADGGVRGDGEGALDVFRNPDHGKMPSSHCSVLKEVAFPKNISELFPCFRRYRAVGIQATR